MRAVHYWDVVDVIPVMPEGQWSLRVRFRDGTEGMVVLHPEFFRGVFSSLKNPEQFARVRVCNGVVSWSKDSGLDALELAPDAMYEAIKRHGTQVLT